MDRTGPHASHDANLFRLLTARAASHPHAAALIAQDGAAWNHATLAREATLLAEAIAEAGARPGDRLMMQVAKSPRAVALYLACLRAGVILIPLNPAYGADELDYLAADAEPSVIVADPASPFAKGSVAAAASAEVLTLAADGSGTLAERAGKQPGTAAPHTAERHEIAAILYTSGTTGRPKGAMISHDNLASNARALCETWGITSNDTLLHALPIFHTHGLFVAINTALIAGAPMHFLPKFEPDAVFAAMRRSTLMMGVPTFYTRLLADPRLTREATAHMRLFISGSAPLLRETLDAFEARTGHRILERYGMTETNMITSNPLDGERRPGAVGFPLPGVEIRIADESGSALPRGEIGGIELTGPNVFRGYWRNPAKTAEEFRPDGWFRTGDLGRIDAEGYLHIVGRAKDLIITGGFNVYPKEVEGVIDALPGVAESAVIGVPHPDFGEAVTAVVVASDPAVDPEAIREASREKLAAFKAPKAVRLVEALPRNAMGKVEKAKLRARYADIFGK